MLFTYEMLPQWPDSANRWLLATIGGLFAAILLQRILVWTYRLYFHPLAKYPGPFLAKITSLYAVYYAYTGDVHVNLDRCHKKYGNFVRYGPNRLVIGSTKGYHDIYSTTNKVRKSESYVAHGPGNIIGIQGRAEHAKERRVFSQGFSDSALRSYEPTILRTTNIFCDTMLENANDNEWSEARNMSTWCFYFATDIMSQVVFTASWDLLRKTEYRKNVKETVATVIRLITCIHQSPLYWKYQQKFCHLLPNLWWSAVSLTNLTVETTAKREALLESNPDIKDLMSTYSSPRKQEDGSDPVPPPYDIVLVNSATMIIGGSDTAKSSIAATFFYLANNPKAYYLVANEIRNTFKCLSSIQLGPLLNSCVYLHASITEAMRLTPPGCHPFWRVVEGDGATFDGEFIPGGVDVGSGIYKLHHNEAVFDKVNEYDIERWIAKGEQDRERVQQLKRNFVPFSTGARQCIAKNLAWNEMLIFFAVVFFRMDFEAEGDLGAGKDGVEGIRGRTGEFQLKGFYVSQTDGPMIRFKKRQDVLGVKQKS